MKERPILFNTENVKAILDGRKTQTRRVCVAQGGAWKGKQLIDVLPMRVPSEWVGLMQHDPNKGQVFKCRYGQVGDKLWVRETWAAAPTRNNIRPIYLHPDEPIHYKATYPNESHFVWRPSIFMPRWASRITLEITGIRVERLQDITEDDIEAEGVIVKGWTEDGSWRTPHNCFEWLWDSINAKKYPWESNPFVWVIEFKL